MRPLRRRDAAKWSSTLPLASICLFFVTASAGQSQYCSTENTGTAGPYFSIYQSHGFCTQHCGGYAFGILQNQQCWCSNYAPDSSDATCSLKCPGYPSDDCGSDGGAYSYITLGQAPSGTGIAGAGGQVPSSQPIFEHAPSPSPSPLPTPSPSPPSDSPPSEPPPEFSPSDASIPTFTPIVPLDSDTTTPEPSVVTAKPITSIQVITVSGEAQTQVVTQLATPPPRPSAVAPEVQELPAPSKHGLSNGAVAGITIGVLVVVGVIVGLGVFIWRRRKNSNTDSEGNIRRNPSVLSRVGLLRGDSGHADIPYPAAAASSTLPRIRTKGLGLRKGSGPGSAVTNDSQMSEARRTSKPLFVDQRLNPNALMEHSNASRTSVGTLQDDKDYTRPLEVRNPD